MAGRTPRPSPPYQACAGPCPAGRALLMDFGSSDFRTSVHWLMQRYAELGVQFDEIWAYELKQMDLNQYWASVPADAKLRLHVRRAGNAQLQRCAGFRLACTGIRRVQPAWGRFR